MRTHISELGALADPYAKEYTRSLQLDGWQPIELARMYTKMLRIRLVEEAIAELSLSGEARCPCHLGIGQEAAAVGVAHYLNNDDRAFGAHRSHSHFLAMGGNTKEILSEVLGKVTGCSRGMGGSMHLFGKEFGFYGSVPIVAGTIPLAVGAALAAKMDGNGAIAVAFFGDGSSEEGALHECLNLASQYELPVLFVCENNLYSSHLDISQRQPSDSIARFADAHKVRSEIVDGNNVVEVAATVKEITASMRNGDGPAFLEAVTFRWRGHVGADENIDVGVRRSLEDVAAWKARDPIARLRQGIVNTDVLSPQELDEINISLVQEIADAVDFAKNSPYPEDEQNENSVYSEKE